MKTILILLISFYSFSQTTFDRSKTLIMDNEVVPYIEEFIRDGEKRGFDLRSYLINRIDYIYFNDAITNSGKSIIGMVGLDGRGFYLHSKLKLDPIKLRLTIYHEIGHIFKKSGYHSCVDCYDIMTQIACSDLSVFESGDFWDDKVDAYFIWLNTK